MISPDKVAGIISWEMYLYVASNSETQGITYIEALACGLPALCRRDDCLSQVVTDGYNGFQYETMLILRSIWIISWSRKRDVWRWDAGARKFPAYILLGISALLQRGLSESYRASGEIQRRRTFREEKNTETKNRWKEIPASWARVIMKRGA